jgi:hypothetical protein
MNSPIYLLANGSATGASYEWPGGEGVFMAEFTGGTVTLEYDGPNPDVATWFAVGTETTLAASGGAVFYLPAGSKIRAAVAGATGVYATVKQID